MSNQARDRAGASRSQPDLFSPEPAFKGGTLDAQFLRFVEDNPHVLRRFVALARELQERGVKSYGAKAIWEVMRYEALRTRGETLKLNNNYVSRMARLAMTVDPRLKGFFSTRELSSRDDVEDASSEEEA